MGVDRTDYIVYGWKLPYKLNDPDGNPIENFWDIPKYEKLVDGGDDDGFQILEDGMAGTYCVFGKVIESGGDQWEGWDFVELEIDNMDKHKAIGKLVEHFQTPTVGWPEPKLFLFSHFH
jgi:hypothetical protein